jgi:hypothetical protein
VFCRDKFFRILDYPGIAGAAPYGPALFGEDLTGLGVLNIAGRFNDGYLD